MKGRGVGTDEPATSDADELLARWVAALVDRISSGESLDLDALALDHPEGVERARRLMPALAIMARLRTPSSRCAVELTGHGAVAAGFEPGTSLGDFRTIREIGRGGMGVVYDAIQVSLNRRVALKILPVLSAGDPQKLRRFQVEAQAAACLHHPHIVPVYLVGSDGDAHYFAMQFIEGQTLAQLIAELRRQRDVMPPDAGPSNGHRYSHRFVADLARQAAQALHYAHEQGIVHRDVKPSNLMVEGSGRLWVADFGLARISGAGDLTATGALLGTLRYMSPEQIVGPRAVVDHRADIYSLGATLYELIALRPAFESDDRFELLRRIADQEPPRPRRIDRGIPRDLETIVLKAMAKDPADRYATARAMSEDLGRFLEHRPILARPPGAIDRAAKWTRRHKLAVAAASVFLFAAVLALAGVGFWRDSVLRRHNRELSAALERAERMELAIRRHSYDSQMRLAQRSYSSAQVELAQEILEGLRPEPGERDLRGFEWHYLRQVCDREVSVLTDRETSLMALSPDGRLLAMGDRSGYLVVWDLATGRERIRFRGHAHEVSGLVFSSDGSVLATWSTLDGRPSDVKLWDATSGRPCASSPQIQGNITSMYFSADSRGLVILERELKDFSKNRLRFWSLDRAVEQSASEAMRMVCDRMAYSADRRWMATSTLNGNTVTLRDGATAEPIKVLVKRFPEFWGVALSTDGRTLAAHSQGITIWDVPSGRELGSLPLFLWRYATFSPDGNRFAGVTIAGQTIELIVDVKTKPREVFLERPVGADLHLAFSPDSKTLAGGGSGLAPTLWDTSTGRKKTEFPGHTWSVGPMLFKPDGESLIIKGTDGRVRSWHFGKKSEQFTQLAGHAKEVWAVAYTPGSTTLISAGDDASIKLWNVRDGKLRATLKGHDALVASLAISPDGRMLASASFDKTVRLWGLADGRLRGVLTGHDDRVRAVVFSPDGRHVASAGSDHSVRVWDVDGGEAVVVFNRHTDTVRALAYHPDATLLVSAGNDRTIRAIEVNRGGREKFAIPWARQISALAFSPDGSHMASGDDGGNVTIWDVATWSKQASVKESDAPIWGLSFSPDGRSLAAACGDAKVRLVDPITGQVVLVLDGHTHRVNAVAFSPDGQALASGSHEGAIRLWHASEP